MNIGYNIKIILSDEEQKAVAKVKAIVREFADKNLCDKIPCSECPLALFCSFPANASNFEETLNDIANME